MAKGKKQTGKSVSVYLDNEVVREVEKDADQQDRSNSYIVNRILRSHYEKEKRIK